MLEIISAKNLGLHLNLGTSKWEPSLYVKQPFEGLFVSCSVLFCFFLVLILLASQNFYCNSSLFPKCCSKISYLLLCQAFHCFQFLHSTVDTRFSSCWNNLLILCCSILWSNLLIFGALASILCFSASRNTFNPFFLSLYLRSITLYFSFYLISPRFFYSKMLIFSLNF